MLVVRVLKLQVHAEGVDIRVSPLPRTDPLYELEVALAELDLLVVEFVPDLEPPLLIALPRDEVVQLILFLGLSHLAPLDIVALVVI